MTLFVFFLAVESLSPQLPSLSPQDSSLPQLPQLAKEVEVVATEAMENMRPIRTKRMNLFMKVRVLGVLEDANEG